MFDISHEKSPYFLLLITLFPSPGMLYHVIVNLQSTLLCVVVGGELSIK
jgi:hypothetical protein